MSIGGADDSSYQQDGALHDMPSPGSRAALDLLLDHIASELAVEYVDRMRAATQAACESKTHPYRTSRGAE